MVLQVINYSLSQKFQETLKMHHLILENAYLELKHLENIITVNYFKISKTKIQTFLQIIEQNSLI